MDPPPPPPRHGEYQRPADGLPPGKFDIFIIPPSQAGGGFLYLPSLRPHTNSFVAGFVAALALCYVWTTIQYAVHDWWLSMKASGGAGILMLLIAVGLGAWVLGKQQSDGNTSPRSGGSSPMDGGSQSHKFPGFTGGPAPGAAPPRPPQPGPYQQQQQQQPPPASGYTYGSSAGPAGAEDSARTGWQRQHPQAAPESKAPPGPTPRTEQASGPSAKGAWERAREETRRREEERKAKETEQKRKDDVEQRLKELREKEARERAAREQRSKEAKEQADREKGRADREKTAKERLEKLRAEREQAQSSKSDPLKPPASTYAYSAMGEKTNPWPNSKPSPGARSQPGSPPKRPPPPTAKSYRGTDEDAYSYRPYDEPKPAPPKKQTSSNYSESSYTPSHSTSRTTPEPGESRRPYTTKDPDKIVIKAVYSFNAAFMKTPISQLVSGVGPVTDGLILRITTEGLFIDDDVRQMGQREWDIRAWTLKLVEVWCPSFRESSSSAASRAASMSPATTAARLSMRRLWGLDKEKPATSEETDALLMDMANLCRTNCAHAPTAASTRAPVSNASSPLASKDNNTPINRRGAQTNKDIFGLQTGEHKAAGLHLIRASIRDHEGKRYIFVMAEEESWKVALGLQRLRKGSQVRSLGVSGMSVNDAKMTLEGLGWLGG